MKWTLIAYTSLITGLFATLLTASQPSANSIVQIKRISSKSIPIFRIKRKESINLNRLLGRFHAIKCYSSQDENLKVFYLNSSKYPDWTAIVVWEDTNAEILCLKMVQQYLPENSRVEYGSQEAWIPLNNNKLLIWAPYREYGLILDTKAIRGQSENAPIEELFKTINLSSEDSSQILFPIRLVPCMDGSNESDLMLNGRKLKMDGHPYYYWK